MAYNNMYFIPNGEIDALKLRESEDILHKS
jgi:hypothetical protein